MGLLKRRVHEPINVEELYAQAHEEVVAEKARNKIVEACVLNTIGETTDPLADRAMLIADGLPEPERTLFMRSVLQRVVLQALHGVEVPVQKPNNHLQFEATRFGHNVLSHYGSGMPFIGNAPLESVVIDESLPVYEQPALEI